MSSLQPAALFLFAHQDDEFGIFQKIIDECHKGHRVYCAYLTDGRSKKVSPERRNQESLSVLIQLGIKEKDIFFAGNMLTIPDAELPEYMNLASDWIKEWFKSIPIIEAIYIPAWEGGHQDHDALHAITVAIAHKMGILNCVWQFSLYNAYRCVGTLFRVFLPLPLNGKVENTRILWKWRFQFLRYCLSYPSQLMTWVGLFPFVALHYLTSGVQMLQPVSYDRIRERPHDGALYYERRGFYTWEKMTIRLSNWLNTE